MSNNKYTIDDTFIKMTRDNKRKQAVKAALDQASNTPRQTRPRKRSDKSAFTNVRNVLTFVAVGSVMAFALNSCNNMEKQKIADMANSLDKNHKAALQLELNSNDQLAKYLSSNKKNFAKYTDNILKTIKAKDPLSREKIEMQIDLLARDAFRNNQGKPLSEINAIVTTQILDMYQDAIDGKIYLYYDYKNDDKEPHIAGLKYSDDIRELIDNNKK